VPSAVISAAVSPAPDHVDDVIGGADGGFVVLDDDDGVADVADSLDASMSLSLSRGWRRWTALEDVDDAGKGGAELVARRTRWPSPPESVDDRARA